MDITVTVWLDLNVSFIIDSELRIIINQGWHHVLLHEEDLLLTHAEVIILLEKG